MNGSTSGKTRWTRSISILTGVAGLAASAALVGPQAFGGTAGSAPGGTTEVGRPPATAAVVAVTADAETTYESGIALSGTAVVDGRQVFVEIYGNSTYGSQATVVVESAGGPNLAAHVEDLDLADLLDGDVSFDLALSRMTRGTEVPTRERVQVVGSYVESGPVREVDETYEDAGYVIHTTGTNTPLDADVVVTLGGEEAVLEVGDAFAYDLTVVKTPL